MADDFTVLFFLDLPTLWLVEPGEPTDGSVERMTRELNLLWVAKGALSTGRTSEEGPARSPRRLVLWIKRDEVRDPVGRPELDEGEERARAVFGRTGYTRWDTRLLSLPGKLFPGATERPRGLLTKPVPKLGAPRKGERRDQLMLVRWRMDADVYFWLVLKLLTRFSRRQIRTPAELVGVVANPIDGRTLRSIPIGGGLSSSESEVLAAVHALNLTATGPAAATLATGVPTGHGASTPEGQVESSSGGLGSQDATGQFDRHIDLDPGLDDPANPVSTARPLSSETTDFGSAPEGPQPVDDDRADLEASDLLQESLSRFEDFAQDREVQYRAGDLFDAQELHQIEEVLQELVSIEVREAPPHLDEERQLAISTASHARQIIARLTRLLDALAAQEGKFQTETLLSLVGALLLVPGLIAGIYGSNILFPLKDSVSGWRAFLGFTASSSSLALCGLLAVSHDWKTRRLAFIAPGRPVRGWGAADSFDWKLAVAAGPGFTIVPAFIGAAVSLIVTALFDPKSGLLVQVDRVPWTSTIALLALLLLNIAAIGWIMKETFETVQPDGAASDSRPVYAWSDYQLAVTFTAAIIVGSLVAL